MTRAEIRKKLGIVVLEDPKIANKELTQEEAEKQLSFLCQQGYLIKSEEAGNIRYQKAG